MAYAATTWVEGVTTLGPTNLNHLETGLATADATATAAVPKSTVTTSQDLIVASGNAAVTRLGVGATGQVLGIVAGVLTWVYPPGYEIGYDQITSTINVASTTEGTPTAIIAGTAHTYENVGYHFEFFCPELIAPSTTGGTVTILLMQDGASIGRIAVGLNDITGGQTGWPTVGWRKFTPSAASHTFGVSAFCSATTGTPAVTAGAAGSGIVVPAFLRVTKA
jgi:hypothetical protein